MTGSTGFIGRHLAGALVHAGEEVVALVPPWEIKTPIAKRLRDLGVKLVEGDVTDPKSLQNQMKDARSVHHLAGVVAYWSGDKSVFYKVNVEGTENVLQEAQRAGVERVVYTSSDVAIGGRKGDIVDEETPHSGFFASHYDRSKYLGLVAAMKLHRDQSLPLVVVMPSVVIGPEDVEKPAGRILLDFLNGRLPGLLFGDSSFGLVYVNDVVHGHLLAEKRGKIGQKYILSAGNFKLREIFAVVSEISGIPVPGKEISPFAAKAFAYLMEFGSFFSRAHPRLPIGLVRQMEHGLMLDGSKAERELGLRYTPIQEALAGTLRWYSENSYAPRPTIPSAFP